MAVVLNGVGVVWSPSVLVCGGVHWGKNGVGVAVAGACVDW